MALRYCSKCVKQLTPPFFLKDASSLPSSKVFATCYICREKGRCQQSKRKRPALPEIDPNVGPPLAQRRATSTSRTSFSPSVINHGLPPPVNPLPRSPPPVQPPVSPVQLPLPPPPDTFIPTDQWQTITEFHTHMSAIKMEECSRCNARWFDMQLRNNICYSCLLKDKGRQTLHFFSADNDMDPGIIPAHLLALTQIEEMVIARSHVQMMIKRYRGHQYQYTGHCVSFAQEIIKTVSILPNLPEELDIILLRPSRQAIDNPRYQRQFQQDFRVRKGHILTWLCFLQAHHPDYRYITICNDRIQSLPDDGDVSHLLSALDIGEDEGPDPQEDVPGLENNPQLPNTQSTIPNSSADDTEINQILQELTGQNLRDIDVPAPSIRATPIDEATGSQRIFVMAFPTLYPLGRADFNAPRQRGVTLKEYAHHLMRYSDGRFGRHPRWRFLVFNILMRKKSTTSARYYISKASNMINLTREELGEALNSDSNLLSQIVRQGSSLIGTHPFWRNKGTLLQAQARFLTQQMSPVFITLSCADLQWHDLHYQMPRYDDFLAGNDMIRRRIIWGNVQDCPHIVAYYLDLRFRAFLQLVIKPYLGFTDHWWRYEWQSRGSGHLHCLFWVPTAPSLGQSTAELRSIFARYWGDKITAWNPNPSRAPDAQNPASLLFSDVANSTDQFSAFLNRLQMHTICRPGACLRIKKGSEDTPHCRFFFPRPLFNDPVITKDINHKSWLFSPARNVPDMNQCSPLITMGWMANTDVQPPTTLYAVLAYVAKYVSKPETKSRSYTDLQGLILPYINDRVPLLSFVSKMLNKLIGERDWSAQEVSHLLLQLPVQESSRSVVTLDCRPEQSQDNLIVLEDGDITTQRSPIKRYQDRKTDAPGALALHSTSLFDWLQFWDWKTFAVRPRAPSRVINYWPRYPADPELPTYNDFCRVKLMLHHLFVHVDELLSVDGVAYSCYQEAFTACYQHHSHPEDYYVDPEPEAEELDDSDNEYSDDIEPDPEVEAPLADFEAYAQQRPNRDLGQLDGLDGLGTRHIDRAYDWSLHVGKYSLDSEDWGRLRAENPIEQAVDVSPSAGSLNLEQRKLYDIVVNQYIQELSGLALPQQLLLNVDGVAGSGKTYTLLKICAQLQDLALRAGKQNPVFRAAPTGIAAYNICGKTLHSLLRLPVRIQQADISASTLQALQLLFKSCRFLIVDEKSMIDLKTLSLIDDRLRAILPHNAHNPFGGINVLLCGDFFQLPPVCGRALYSSMSTTPETIKGQQLYRSFDRTVRLVQVIRQQGEDNVSICFRAALGGLREGKLSRESWELFCTRVVNQLSPDEVSMFDNALRLYFTKEEVYNRNIQCLTARNMPIKILTAVNRGRDAEKATDDEAENLANKIYICIGARIMLSSNLWTEIGLVNGSMGTVVDIIWQSEPDPTTSLPFAILIRFDTYSGPVFPGCNAGIVPVFAELHRFDYRGTACTRLQFPLRLAYGITVHKSQGLTLSRAVLNLATKEHTLGLSYVAVSRVKTLPGLLFECAFDYDHFQVKETNTFKDRELDILIRNRQII